MAKEKADTAGGVRTPIPRLSDGRRRRRTADQRLNLRFPGLYRRITGMLSRLSPRSRVRQSLLPRALALAYAAANRQDFDVVLLGLEPGFEYRPARDLMPPDLEPVFTGHEGYVKLWRYWLDAFGDIRWEPEEVLDFGDRFVVTTQQRGSGSGSGVAVSEPVYQVFTTRRGMVVRQEDFRDRAEALDAAAVSDERVAG
jgi:hypothetical protein